MLYDRGADKKDPPDRWRDDSDDGAAGDNDSTREVEEAIRAGAKRSPQHRPRRLEAATTERTATRATVTRREEDDGAIGAGERVEDDIRRHRNRETPTSGREEIEEDIRAETPSPGERSDAEMSYEQRGEQMSDV